MFSWDVDWLDVVDEEPRKIGVLTERDLLRHFAGGGATSGVTVIDLLTPAPAEPVHLPRSGAMPPTTPSTWNGQVAGHIMSSPGIACREDAWFEEVAELLADREISGVPVVNNEGVVTGVISERDLAHALGGPLIRLAIRRPVHSGPFLRLPRGISPGARRARDIMTSPAVTAHPDTPIRTLAEIMVKDRVNRIPIVRAGRLVGVVTRTDVLGAVAGLDRRKVETEEPPVVAGSVWGEVSPKGIDFPEPVAVRGQEHHIAGSDRP